MTSTPSITPMGASDPAAPFIHDTVHWLEKAVIGLNLCPFAKGVHVKGQIHYVVALTEDTETVLSLLREELLALQKTPAEVRDTTLLVLPHCLQDFLDFNDFLGDAEGLLDALGLDGILQIASFHPQFQFAGTEVDDVTNCTNRAPYPTLHLLREDSIDRAVEVFPEAEAIFERNMEVLEGLGLEGWRALDVGPHVVAPLAVDPQGQGAR
ncbi:DUF1415 domain-containing protein [Acidovorax sp. NB1]|uniref:DUF1415 domain-containing protein n=1 Tax=Acidovorax sp. NB1 TaxID=1943571 RepID=UPI0010D5EB0D|nr:DUF1415 domain-containing protein [Acidovorax sp. NB1]GDY35998.1 hypothetical protein ACINB_18900 [Acidovorax sp. NB1]